MRVLIIGPGYVGLALGIELARVGHQVSTLGRSSAAGHSLQLAGISPLVGDITRPGSLPLPAGRFDWVVNCASSTHGDAEDYRRTYLDGAHNLVAWLRDAPPVRFVYTGSTGVYAQEDGSRVDENSPALPVTETGRVLARAEQVYLKAAPAGFPAIVLRVAGIYGPGRGWWLKQFLAGEARLEDGGRRMLNMIHRDDVVGCIIAALAHGRPGEIYNAVDDEPVSQHDLLAWFAASLNRPMPLPAPAQAPSDRKRGTSDKRVSNAKLKTELRYRFRFPTFREGYAAEVAALSAPASS